MLDTSSFDNWYFSPNALKQEVLTEELRALARRLVRKSTGDGGVLISTASEIINRDSPNLPLWAVDPQTRYLIVADAPLPAIMHLPAILRVHKPDLRLHVTEDPVTVRRLLVAQARPAPVEGIIDAYVVAETLVAILGDLTIRRFPIDKLSVLKSVAHVADLKIDIDGSFIEWTADDIHLSASGLLKQIDPAYLARLEIERAQTDMTGPAILRMRERIGIRQSDVDGLSERQVRRVEKGVSNLTLEAARSFAAAFGMDLRGFLDDLSREISHAESQRHSETEGDETREVA